MRIDNAIMSVNDVDHYQWFWPHVSRLWVMLGIKPILLWVTDRDVSEFNYPSEYGEIHTLPVLRDDRHQSSMLARIYGCAAFEGVNLLMDIDLFPISRWYFTERLADIPNEDLAHISTELPYLGKYGKLPIPIYAGSNRAYTNMLLMNPTLWTERVTWDNTFMQEFEEYTANLPGEQNMNDEGFLYQKVIKYAYVGNAFHIRPRWGRRYWSMNTLRKELSEPIDLGHFYDAHLSPRVLKQLYDSGEDLFPHITHLIDRVAAHLGESR